MVNEIQEVAAEICDDKDKLSRFLRFMAEETIRIVTDDTPQSEGAKTGQDIAQMWDVEVQPAVSAKSGTDVSVDKLEQEMARFMQQVDGWFSRAEQIADMKYMQLDEVELTVEINGEGKVSLFGAGAKVGGKKGITLRFKRRS